MTSVKRISRITSCVFFYWMVRISLTLKLSLLIPPLTLVLHYLSVALQYGLCKYNAWTNIVNSKYLLMKDILDYLSIFLNSIYLFWLTEWSVCTLYITIKPHLYSNWENIFKCWWYLPTQELQLGFCYFGAAEITTIEKMKKKPNTIDYNSL